MNISCLKHLFGLAIALCVPLALRADHIVFNDLTSNVTVTTDGSKSRFGGPGCGFVFMDPNEDCVLLLSAPLPGTHPDFNLFQFVAYSEPGDPTKVSDSLQVSVGSLPFPPFISYYDIHFFSAGPTNDTPCNTVANGCIGPETGSIQTAFTLEWFDSTGAIASTDTISFQSGTVPEPSAIPWLLVASALLGIAVRRRTLVP